MKVVTYPDGACTKNGRSGAKASWAYYLPEHRSLSGSGPVPEDQPQTNNRGELLAIHNAIEKVIASFEASATELYVYTDSEYSRNCLTKWIMGWMRNNWKTAEGKPVANRDLIEDISKKLICFQSYTINHVRAHTGGTDEHSKNNEIVDRMAAGVLDPSVVTTPEAIETEGCPLKLMGPPVTESQLVSWCMKNLDSLDKDALRNAIISAFIKTCKKNGTEVTKQTLHKTTQYRLTASSHIIVDNNKEE
jgi:ribonuclease HI